MKKNIPGVLRGRAYFCTRSAAQRFARACESQFGHALLIDLDRTVRRRLGDRGRVVAVWEVIWCPIAW